MAGPFLVLNIEPGLHFFDDGLQNRLESPPRIWHVLSLFHIHSYLFLSHSVACTTSCGRPANPLFVRRCSDFPLLLSAHSSLHYITGQWFRRPRQIRPFLQNAWLRKLPSHPSLITKTGTAILGSGLLAAAISQELCVFNEETVIAAGYIIFFAYTAKVRWFIFLLNSSSVMFIETCHTHRPFACHTESGPRTILLASKACSMVRVQNTRGP